ncbi:MAG: hypothetical protein EOO99_01995 [Pedobacter sp.]|nr:MAG: hypothetical protein EOO99_01995 [Pedobacter sp.]
MSAVTQKLDRIFQRTSQLMELCEALQQENKLLRAENLQQKQALDHTKKLNLELDEKIRLLKLAKSIDGADEKTLDIKQKINEFVREIDKCVMLLKK